MATKKPVRLLLSPNDKLAGAPNSTWPRPAGVTVRFTNEADPDDVQNAVTGPGGLAEPELLQGATYAVEIHGDEWERWEPAQTPMTVPRGATVRDPIDLILVPRDNLWLVALRLCRQRPDGPPVADAVVTVTGGPHGEIRQLRSRHDGSVYAVAAEADLTLDFQAYDAPGGERLLPWDDSVDYSVQAGPDVEVTDIVYLPAIHVTVEPTVEQPGGGQAALTGAEITVVYRSSEFADAFEEKDTLAEGEQTVSFEFRFPGVYQVTVKPPAVIGGWPVVAGPRVLPSRRLGPGAVRDESADFQTIAGERIHGEVLTPAGKPLDEALALQFYDDGDILIRHTAGTGGPFQADVPADVSLQIRLDPDADNPGIEGIPLEMSVTSQDLVRDADNVIVLQYRHAIMGSAVDEAGNPAPFAVIDVFNDQQHKVRSGVADDKGLFTVGLADGGYYFVAVNTKGGEPVTRAPVSVQSVVQLPRPLVVPSGGMGAASRQFPREAFTDLASYPVLTEEIATTGGFPAPSGTGPAAGYGQMVDQVMRDVLGWRPGADVSGFQAALAGAFQLRDVAGHTEWTWQQRGYSVQADMGALTGAQASIYARAKSALDQILPLLAGLTMLNPSVSTPDEREAMRTVVTSEINELVSELSFEGGPRIQRVDELFTLLTGQGITAIHQNPDDVSGHLGTLRQRFALTVDQVDTIDDERVLTNFRVVVEQVLALQTSWRSDRDLLSGVGPDTSLGTLLIWLSRSLEAVGDSVDELSFTLDSVFIDAAQRQVVELRFAGITVDVPDLPLKNGGTSPVTFPSDEPPMMLSDLLNWVTRATKDEGPRLVQDAGKDGVAAFAPVLDRLRRLVRAIHKITGSARTLPAGMRTPRVHRALNVLAGQLDEAADLAKLVQQAAAPTISAAWWVDSLEDALSQISTRLPLRQLHRDRTRPVWVVMVGSNFRGPATAVLTAIGRPDLPVLYEHAVVRGTSYAYAKITHPGTVLNSAGTTWRVSLVNDDATQSNEVAALQV